MEHTFREGNGNQMIYVDFQGEQLSMLGMGTMRLPVIDGDDSKIDVPAAEEMIDYAYKNGVNYFDTAWGYHGGNSEKVVGAALKRYDRSSFSLASKFPSYDTGNFGKHEEIFSKQLEKCQVEYFDFYLLHNINEGNIEQYLDEDTYHTVAYFKEQKAAGKIRHLGFSTHGTWDTFKRFMDRFGDDMEFCQVECNYLDWEFQDAKRKVDYLNERGIAVWVMEPLRGGYLCSFDDEQASTLAALRPETGAVEWALRWLQTRLPQSVVLTGASTLEQLQENIRIFSDEKPLSAEELAAIDGIAHDLVGNIGLPCTACRYCISHCPVGLDIPMLLSLFNEYRSKQGEDWFIPSMAIGLLPEDKRPSACIGCGSCHEVCPQALAIPEALEELATAVEKA